VTGSVRSPRDRYATESARLLGVLDERLASRDFVMGADYSIADISLLGWVRNLIGFYEARKSPAARGPEVTSSDRSGSSSRESQRWA
jgi:glutathione S-transferase